MSSQDRLEGLLVDGAAELVGKRGGVGGGGRPHDVPGAEFSEVSFTDLVARLSVLGRCLSGLVSCLLVLGSRLCSPGVHRDQMRAFT